MSGFFETNFDGGDDVVQKTFKMSFHCSTLQPRTRTYQSITNFGATVVGDCVYRVLNLVYTVLALQGMVCTVPGTGVALI